MKTLPHNLEHYKLKHYKLKQSHDSPQEKRCMGNLLLWIGAAGLSLGVKYGLPWWHLQPTPVALVLWVSGPALGMALWLLWTRAATNKSG